MQLIKNYKLHFLLLLLLQINLTLTRKIRDDCNDIASNSSCLCKQAGIEYEVSCPADSAWSPTILVIIRPDMNVHIECNKMNANVYSLLPTMSIGNNPMVVIKKCPLPGHTPIAKIFHKLGITNVNALLFESDNFDVNLTSEHLSGLQNLKRLRVNSKSLTHLPEDLFLNMKNLTWLELRSGGIELPANIFSGMENLIYLELSHKNLQYLPPGVFRNQKNLKALNLWSNQLGNLTKDVFLGISGLKELDLSTNYIERFEPDIFSTLTNLSNINLNGNYFKELPQGLFAHNRNLTHFRLMNNRVPLRTLPPGLLSNMLQLSKIVLSCDLETLPGDMFENSTTITNITIIGNNLATLPEQLFADQHNLVDLDLSNNNLQKLPNDLLANTKKLIILKLSQNHLTEITKDLFSQLFDLQYLYMDNNDLKHISQEAFAGTAQLRFINMENNQIDFRNEFSQLLDELEYPDCARSSAFNKLTNLETLNLRNNSVQCIFLDWKVTMRYINFLDLSYNKISALSVHDMIFVIRHLLNVNLTHNNLQSIDFSNISDIERSESGTASVDLGSNPINCDCNLLHFVQFLRKERGQHLSKQLHLNTDNLVCNSPENLRGTLVRNVNPMHLLCAYEDNSKEKACPRGCECHIRSYDAVFMINCSNAHLSKVPVLPHIENYNTELYIENNTITQLPNNNRIGYAQVTKILAANNNLSNLVAGQLPPGLTHLDLSNNQLKYLNASALSYFNTSHQLESLKLANNPWSCACERKALVEYAWHNKKIEDWKQMSCYNSNGELRRLAELSVNEICPPDNGFIILIAVMIALLGCLMGLLGVCYYKFQYEIHAWIYWHIPLFRFMFRKNEENKLYDCFISYSHKDEKFVADFLVKELERLGFTLCVHGRDWLPGECIPDNIDRSVDESRRTVVVLSQNFVESSWSRMEFRNAHKKALEEKCPKVLVILYGDLDMESLDHELKAYLSSYTYLKWGEPWFWERLIFSLPHHKHDKEMGLAKSVLKGSTDDKLELIKPAPVTPPLTTPPGETAKNPIVAQFNGGTPQTAVMIPNGKMANGLSHYYSNGKTTNGHINGAFIINTNAKQSDV